MRFFSLRFWGHGGSDRRPARAFTLVELLVVVGIIMVVAASTLLILDQTDDQVRFDKTRQGYKDVHTAMFGPGMLTTLSGNLVISGYLADTGKLPTSLNDLLTQPTTVSAWAPVAPASLGGRIQQGWRGPYISQTESGLNDAWGNPWRYAVSDSALNAALRYRAGYSPPGPPPTIDFGSYGKDGLPGGTKTYDVDFPPTNFTLQSPAFALTAVTVPRRTIQKQTVNDLVLNVGVIYAGLSMTDAFANHPSLLRDSTGVLVTVTVPGNYPPGTILTTTTTDSKGKTKTTTTVTTTKTVTLPANLTFNLGYARQFQVVLYNPLLAGTTLTSKLYSVDTSISSFLPRVNSSGSELTTENVEASVWLTP